MFRGIKHRCNWGFWLHSGCHHFNNLGTLRHHATASIERAIALNGVAVEQNLRAFRLGRLAAQDPMAIRRLLGETAPTPLLSSTN